MIRVIPNTVILHAHVFPGTADVFTFSVNLEFIETRRGPGPREIKYLEKYPLQHRKKRWFMFYLFWHEDMPRFRETPKIINTFCWEDTLRTRATQRLLWGFRPVNKTRRSRI